MRGTIICDKCHQPIPDDVERGKYRSFELQKNLDICEPCGLGIEQREFGHQGVSGYVLHEARQVIKRKGLPEDTPLEDLAPHFKDVAAQERLPQALRPVKES
jgi:hypothetical protein